MTKLPSKKSQPLKIAIVVPNPCSPDYRVIRQAETLAKLGHEVRIFATYQIDIPPYEEFNGVSYVRSRWNVMAGFVSWITRLYKSKGDLESVRKEHEEILAHAEKFTNTMR